MTIELLRANLGAVRLLPPASSATAETIKKDDREAIGPRRAIALLRLNLFVPCRPREDLVHRWNPAGRRIWDKLLPREFKDVLQCDGDRAYPAFAKPSLQKTRFFQQAAEITEGEFAHDKSGTG